MARAGEVTIVYGGIEDPKNPGQRIPVYPYTGEPVMEIKKPGGVLRFGQPVSLPIGVASRFLRLLWYDDGALRKRIEDDPKKAAQFRPKYHKYIFPADAPEVQKLVEGKKAEFEQARAAELEKELADLKAKAAARGDAEAKKKK